MLLTRGSTLCQQQQRAYAFNRLSIHISLSNLLDPPGCKQRSRTFKDIIAIIAVITASAALLNPQELKLPQQ